MTTNVVRFPTVHVRTSSAGALKPNTAGSACRSSRASAPEKARKCSEGIVPLDRQLLTADLPTPAIEAAAEVPPSAETISSTEVSMAPYSSRFVNMSTDHEMAVDCVVAFGLKTLMREGLKQLGNRLAQTRAALDLSAAELCRRIKCKPNRWSQYENGERKITLEIAHRLCDEFGLTLDWVYRANPAMLPHEIRMKIARAAA